ncbi:hypothetical protein DPMN_084811 [Dreissena polymorpha]|uniref:Uncharacterized protein n=1 Tax=Dreissena polymorpha TaxID=45954 RepID=A0A9D4BL84_DREPO|nr:hypothetical protein DPMN_084811 [Dreissena polymorpha]
MIPLPYLGFSVNLKSKVPKENCRAIRYRVFADLKQQTRPNLLERFHLFRAYEFNEGITDCPSLVPRKNRRDSAKAQGEPYCVRRSLLESGWPVGLRTGSVSIPR